MNKEKETGRPQENSEPLLSMEGITKRFPGVVAVDEVNFECQPGEIHALVGENGAGKTTLMKILLGAYRPDTGRVVFEGQEVNFQHPREAQENGISIVYQEFNLLTERSVAQNIFVGREPTRRGLVDQQKMRKKTGTLLEDLGAKGWIDPGTLVRELSVAQQQIVQIAKALSYESRVLVMDEPTAALEPDEVKLLFKLIRDLRKRGLTIVYISHRLQEVFELSDRITVLKDGQKVGTVNTTEVDHEDIVEMMVGRKLEEQYPERATDSEVGEPLIVVRNGGNSDLHDISFSARSGEVVGIAGLKGEGRRELAEAFFGVQPFETGEIEIKGELATIRSPLEAVRHKMGYVSEDRKQEGLNLLQSVKDNVQLPYRSLQPLFSNVVSGKATGPSVEGLAELVDIRAASYDQEVRFLSGGNQQKVVLAKWLATDAEVWFFAEPTRGIDVQAKAGIHRIIRELAQSGSAILLSSSELPEIIGMSDRILVMSQGTIAGELPAGASEEEIMLLATGGEDADE